MLHRRHDADHDAEQRVENQLVDEQRNARVARHVAARRFGGVDVPASIGGAVAAIGVTVLLGSLAASITALGYGKNAGGNTELTVPSIVAAALTVLVAFVVGGWVAGRMARYDGGRTALLTAGWFVAALVLAAIIGALSDSGYDVLRTVQAPGWLADNAWTVGGVAVMVGFLILMLVAAFAGGLLGERYHRRIDELVAATGARRALGDTESDEEQVVPAAVAEPIDLRDQRPLEREAQGTPERQTVHEAPVRSSDVVAEPASSRRATDGTVDRTPGTEGRHAFVAEGDDHGQVAGSPARRDDRGVAGHGAADWSARPRTSEAGWDH